MRKENQQTMLGRSRILKWSNLTTLKNQLKQADSSANK